MASSWLTEVRAAFGGFGKILGIILAAVSLFSWLANRNNWDLSEAVRELVETYRSIFHPVIDFLFGWLQVDLSEVVKDIAIIYLIIGGSVARTLWAFFSNYGRLENSQDSESLIKLPNNVFGFGMAIVSAVVAWPILVPAILWAPYVYSAAVYHYGKRDRLWGLWKETVRERTDRVLVAYRRRMPTEERYTQGKKSGRLLWELGYQFSLRRVLFLQAVGILLCTGAIVFANVLSR